jgi:hypothetical protein
MGIQAGDVVTFYDGKPVTNFAIFTSLRDAEPSDGEAKELVVKRGESVLRFMIEPGNLGVELHNSVKTTP